MTTELEEYRERYAAAAHAMQSGVMQEHANGSDDASPKHLRVGINSAMVETSVILTLLREKGIITELELAKALAEGMEREKAIYEARLTEALGIKINLA